MEQPAETEYRRRFASSRRFHWFALFVWTVGFLWLPIGFIFHSEIDSVWDASNLNPVSDFVFRPFPTWMVTWSGPYIASIAATCLDYEWKTRIMFLIPPIIILNAPKIVSYISGLM